MSTLEYHKKYSHAKFPCDRCEFSGSSEGQLARHVEEVHAEKGGKAKKRHASDIEIIDDSDSAGQSDTAEKEEEAEGQRVNQGKPRNSN